MIKDLVMKSRSYRRFNEDRKISEELLKELVDLTRYCPSGANLQGLKYVLSAEPEKNGLIFPQLKWAAYLKDWEGPQEGERPAAYILILHDTTVSKSPGCDHGICAQTLLLAAVERGLGGCMLASVNRPQLKSELKLPDHLEILLVVALGEPKEKVVIDPLAPDGEIKYWRDKDQVHHVPKRSLDQILI